VSRSCMAFLVVAIAVALVGIAIADPVSQTTQVGQIFRDCSDCPEMVVAPAGTFLMGSSVAETKLDLDSLPRDVMNSVAFSVRAKFESEHPQHSVTIARSFAMGRYFVTRGEFAAFARDTGYSSSGCSLVSQRYESRANAGWQAPGFEQTDRDPVVCVSWNTAQAYVAWLNSKVGAGAALANGTPYRLPSEAEWEYAARAGTQTVRWWGDDTGLGNADCDGCGSQWDDKRPAPVGSFRPNPFGLFEMLGSAWEWNEDCWNKNYDGAPIDGSAWTNGKWCQMRAIRGGSFNSLPWILRPAMRGLFSSDSAVNAIGFRVVKALQ
jgi:formylglycine-generating enzyme required for sulfatase activity